VVLVAIFRRVVFTIGLTLSMLSIVGCSANYGTVKISDSPFAALEKSFVDSHARGFRDGFVGMVSVFDVESKSDAKSISGTESVVSSLGGVITYGLVSGFYYDATQGKGFITLPSFDGVSVDGSTHIGFKGEKHFEIDKLLSLLRSDKNANVTDSNTGAADNQYTVIFSNGDYMFVVLDEGTIASVDFKVGGRFSNKRFEKYVVNYDVGSYTADMIKSAVVK
jgi:hypothetical protein